MAHQKKPGDPRLAVGYLRVSTEEQHLGPEAQRATIERWAEQSQVRVVAWHTDKGIRGGSELDDRPGLMAAIVDLRTHGAGVLAVAKRDRLARSVEVVVAVEQAIRAAGAIVASADGRSAGDDPGAVFARRIDDAMAEHERALISARTKAALAVKKRRGERVGECPYGYRAGKGGVLVPDEEEQKIALTVYALHRSKASEREIVHVLAERGLHSRAGTPFSQTQVHRILNKRTPANRVVRRYVEPFGKTIIVSVDLYDAIRPFQEPIVPRDETIEPLIDWIADGKLSLRVVSLPHALSPGWEAEIDTRVKACSGGNEHRRLCSMAFLYLEKAGKHPVFERPYAGGRCDVAASDGSIYVECGSMRSSKPIEALLAGQTIMAVPYALGCIVDPVDFDKLMYGEAPAFSVSSRIPLALVDRLKQLLRVTSIQLAYILKPPQEKLSHPTIDAQRVADAEARRKVTLWK